MTETGKFSPEMRAEVVHGNRLFPEIGDQTATYVEHQRSRDELMPTRTLSADYLVNAVYTTRRRELGYEGIGNHEYRRRVAAQDAHDAVSKLVDLQTSEWKYVIKDGKNPYTMSLEEVTAYMEAVMGPIYAVVDPSLDKWKEGFNTHDMPHAKRVARQVSRLLHMAGYDEDHRRRGIIAGFGHDGGNIFNREGHAATSVSVLKATLPSLQDRRQVKYVDPHTGRSKFGRTQWNVIQQAIFLHDSDVIMDIVTKSPKLSIPEYLATMREDIQPEALALLIADKIDIGPLRLSKAVQYMKSIDEDPHIRINNLGQTAGLELSPRKDRLIWTVRYDPNRQVREHRNPGPNFDRWKNHFLGIYPERIQTFVFASFALFGGIDEVEIKLESANHGEIDETYSRVFRVGNMEEAMQEIIDRGPKKKKPTEQVIFSGK